MGRRIGNFIDPNTGETNWLDVSTVKNIRLAPVSITQFKSNNNYQALVNFKLDNIDMLKVIALTAEFETNNKVYKSDAQQMDEMVFAQHLADAVHTEETLDSCEFIRDMKTKALDDLKGKLLSNGILVDVIELKGAGYIISKDTKVMTIDNMAITVNNDRTATVVLEACVGNITLSNLIEQPEIVFYSGGFEFKIYDFEIEDSVEGKIKTYQLSVEDIMIEDAHDEVYFEPVQLDTNNEDSIDEFIASRKVMLDDRLDVDDTLGDRFADIF